MYLRLDSWKVESGFLFSLPTNPSIFWNPGPPQKPLKRTSNGHSWKKSYFFSAVFMGVKYKS